jgi:hypothetical protein
LEYRYDTNYGGSFSRRYLYCNGYGCRFGLFGYGNDSGIE